MSRVKQTSTDRGFGNIEPTPITVMAVDPTIHGKSDERALESPPIAEAYLRTAGLIRKAEVRRKTAPRAPPRSSAIEN
jgi:hypothetical protein